MQLVLIISSTLLIVYGIWFFKTAIASGKAKIIHREYQIILDSKLLPQNFEKAQTIVGGREKIISYKRDILEVALSYEISYDTNRVMLMDGKQSNTLNLNDTIETKNSFIQTLEKWLVQNQ